MANLRDPKAVASLKDLLAQYGRFGKDVKAPYISDLHAELIHGLARGPGRQSLFYRGLAKSPGRRALEALKAYAGSPEKALPIEVLDLRTDGDWRIRAAALDAVASHHLPQAGEYLSAGLLDSDSRVRHSAIAGMGTLGTADALATLKKLVKDPNPRVRRQAVSALAAAKIEGPVVEAAGDQSWPVRQKAAEALAKFPDQKAASTAQHYLDDNSSEVQLAAVRAIDALAGRAIRADPAFGHVQAGLHHPQDGRRAIVGQMAAGQGISSRRSARAQGRSACKIEPNFPRPIRRGLERFRLGGLS